MVFVSTSGMPIEGSTISRLFNKLISDNGLPRVVFHSIRHTRTTDKLMLSGGDIKGVQGDTGHAQAAMMTERYAHILSNKRRTVSATVLLPPGQRGTGKAARPASGA